MGGILEEDFLTVLIGVNHPVHGLDRLTNLVERLIGKDLLLQVLFAAANL